MPNKNVVVRFLAGFQFAVVGLKYIGQHSNLKKWALLPFLLAGAIFMGGVWAAMAWLPTISKNLVDRFGDLGPQAGTVLSILVLFLFGILFLVLHFYLVYLLASLISAPFHSILAEKILIQQGLKNPIHFRFSFLVASLVKTLVLGFIGVTLVLGSFFVPGLNLISAFFLFFMIAYDSADYSLEVLGYSLGRRGDFVKEHLAEFCGMATFVGLTLFIPGLILLLMPAAVSGSAILVFRLHSSAREAA